MYVFQAERYVAKDRFRFSSTIIVGCYHPKKLKIERQQKAKLREKLNAPIFTIRVLGAILILWRLFAHNFIFGAEANISAPGWNSLCNCKKFQPPKPGWDFSPGWNSPCNQALKTEVLLNTNRRGVKLNINFFLRSWCDEIIGKMLWTNFSIALSVFPRRIPSYFKKPRTFKEYRETFSKCFLSR